MFLFAQLHGSGSTELTAHSDFESFIFLATLELKIQFSYLFFFTISLHSLRFHDYDKETKIQMSGQHLPNIKHVCSMVCIQCVQGSIFMTLRCFMTVKWHFSQAHTSSFLPPSTPVLCESV